MQVSWGEGECSFEGCLGSSCAEPFHQQSQMFQSLRARIWAQMIWRWERDWGEGETDRECMPLFSNASNILHSKAEINSEKRCEKCTPCDEFREANLICIQIFGLLFGGRIKQCLHCAGRQPRFWKSHFSDGCRFLSDEVIVKNWLTMQVSFSCWNNAEYLHNADMLQGLCYLRLLLLSRIYLKISQSPTQTLSRYYWHPWHSVCCCVLNFLANERTEIVCFSSILI